MADNVIARVVTNYSDITEKIGRMQAYFATAPDDDPAKVAMAQFGEVDIEKHMSLASDYANGVISVRITPSPEFQRIMDMVP